MTTDNNVVLQGDWIERALTEGFSYGEIITDIMDAATLDCVNELGVITYAEAIDRYRNRMMANAQIIQELFGVTIK